MVIMIIIMMAILLLLLLLLLMIILIMIIIVTITIIDNDTNSNDVYIIAGITILLLIILIPINTIMLSIIIILMIIILLYQGVLADARVFLCTIASTSRMLREWEEAILDNQPLSNTLYYVVDIMICVISLSLYIYIYIQYIYIYISQLLDIDIISHHRLHEPHAAGVGGGQIFLRILLILSKTFCILLHLINPVKTYSF